MSQVEYGANRRASRRRPPKGSTKVRCFRGPMGLGADLAVFALNVSETGASLVLKEPFKNGEELEVVLESIVQRRPIRKKAGVVWCIATAEGRWCVGVKFQAPLRYAELNDLAIV